MRNTSLKYGKHFQYKLTNQTVVEIIVSPKSSPKSNSFILAVGLVP